MKDFVIVHILDSYEIGKLFTMWPLHMTILPPFHATDVEHVLESLKPIMKSTPPIHAELGEFKLLADKRTGRIILPKTALAELHNKVLQAMNRDNLAVSGRYIGTHYVPHVSKTKAGREFDGDKFEIDKIQIVESLPQGYRKVVAEMDSQ